MELYELSNKNGTLTCSFYTKSKLSHETHGFSMTGKNVDKDKEDKIVNVILKDKVPKGVDKMF